MLPGRDPKADPRGGGRETRSALVAVWLAQFDEPPGPAESPSRGYASSRLAALYPQLTDVEYGRKLGTGCPYGPTTSCPHPDVGVTLAQKISHLEERHGRSREQVADWLQAHGE